MGDLLATSDIEAALIFGWHQIFVPKELALWKGVAWCFEEMGVKQVFLLESYLMDQHFGCEKDGKSHNFRS